MKYRFLRSPPFSAPLDTQLSKLWCRESRNYVETSSVEVKIEIFSKILNFFAEILFKARVKRVMGVNSDPSFLNLVENAVISVVAVKFSDRPDIMEGKVELGEEIERKGWKNR